MAIRSSFTEPHHTTQALPGPLGKKQSSLDAAQAGAMSEREQHLRWSGFPIVHSVVASKRFSQHLLIKVGEPTACLGSSTPRPHAPHTPTQHHPQILDARGRDLGQGIVQVLPSPASPSAAAAAAAAKGRETFYPVVERSARAGGGKTEGEGDDEEEEGEETMDLEAGVGSGDPSLSVRRVRLPLTSGSKLKGWLHLDVHVGLEPWSS